MKPCPKCGVQHSKPGTFCSRKCANSRMFSDEAKAKKSVAAKQHAQSKAGIKQRHQKSSDMKDRIKRDASHKQRLMQNLSKGWERVQTAEFREQMRDLQTGKSFITEAGRQRLSTLAKARGLGGQTSRLSIPYTQSDGTMITLQSSYELIVANELDKYGIEWCRPGCLMWIDGDTERRYYPDFYLPQFDMYLDPKNDYLIAKDANKIMQVQEQNNVIVCVLSSEQLRWDQFRVMLG